MTDRWTQTTLTLAAFACVALAVHLASVLLLPRVAPEDAFARIAAPLSTGAVHVLAAADAPGLPVPFRDPLVASAVCRYDLRAGTIRVSAKVTGEAMVAVSFHSREGLPFYGLTDRASNEGTIDLVLMTAAQRARIEAAEQEDPPAREVRVEAPGPEGFVQFDVLARVGGVKEAERAFQSVRCALDGQS